MTDPATDRRPAVIPYLREAHIERCAQQLLVEYERHFGPVAVPPVPIDDIAELHLGLQLEITALQDALRAPGVLGALWVDERRVAIDASLDPETHPTLEGRYRFTLAHEIGHWQLHRHAVDLSRYELAARLPESATFDRVRQRLEYQANLFAAALLMPKALLRAAWCAERGGPAPFCATSFGARFEWLRRYLASVVNPPDPNAAEDLLFEHVSRPLAARFHVSAEAMRIRLERLGLLLRVPQERPASP